MDECIVSRFDEFVKVAGSGRLRYGRSSRKGNLFKHCRLRCRLGRFGFIASRHTAVGLAGVAPRLVPSRGHAALIPDASGPLGLRAPLAVEAVE